MKPIVGIVAGAVVAVAAASVPVNNRAQAKRSVRPLFEKDMNTYAGNALLLSVAEVTFPPGATSTKHRHPGPTFVYVLEGAVEIELEGKPAKVYRAGESFYEEPRELHASTRNVSQAEPAKILAYQLSHKGEPLTTPEK